MKISSNWCLLKKKPSKFCWSLFMSVCDEWWIRDAIGAISAYGLHDGAWCKYGIGHYGYFLLFCHLRPHSSSTTHRTHTNTTRTWCQCTPHHQHPHKHTATVFFLFIFRSHHHHQKLAHNNALSPRHVGNLGIWFTCTPASFLFHLQPPTLISF